MLIGSAIKALLATIGVVLAAEAGKEAGKALKKKKEKAPASSGSLQKQVEKGQAPEEVDRVDRPRVPRQKPHVHFRDGTSLNNDGTVHDAHKGTPNPSNKTSKWLKNHGWKVGN